ncbi:MAG: alkaline phosphatase family protein [Kordiimonadaceae bacterium]|nr:alkaline phosphatase family protein [Kordiimonadaceae bacterium]
MKKCIVLISCIISLSLCSNYSFSEESSIKLIVQITLDQFKSDYIKWYRPAFKYGFKRVLENGKYIESGLVDHAITNSFPGHLSLSTGMYPTHHGFPGNEWWIERENGWGWIDGIADSNTWITGNKDRPGASPKNIYVSTISDWIKDNNPESKAIALSAGQTISIAYGGKKGDVSYWLDQPTGRFITSSYYAGNNPDWLTDFNENELNKFKSHEWKNEIPDEFRKLAEPDASGYENFGKNFTFPHLFVNEKPDDPEMTEEALYNEWFYNTPIADEALFALAKSTITNEKLGQDNNTDYLAIIVNSTDNIGHAFGGRSQEVLDTLLRIDRALGNLLNFLDEKIGKDNYVMAISGDHGAPDIIEFQQARFNRGTRIPGEQIDDLLDAVEEEAKNSNLLGEALVSSLEQVIEKFDFVFDAVTQQEIDGKKESKNPYIDAFRKSWVKGRIPDFPLWGSGQRNYHPARYGIVVQFNENTFFDAAPVVHGSPYSYDRKVPIIFYGMGNFKMNEKARTIDVAPTLASRAGIKIPKNLDGKSLLN